MAGIYIHIPFCRQACNYCNFHFSTSLKNKEALISALIKEIKLTAGTNNAATLIETVYLGGGTPSLLSPGEIDDILKNVHQYFNIAENAEITLEANPDDISKEVLVKWQQAGINRLSLGIQSFNESELKWMNRAHNASESLKSIDLILEAGFNNFSVDLIYGSPLLSNEDLVNNIKIIIEKNIPHLSCYALTVEPKTALHKMISSKKSKPVDEEKQALHFNVLTELLETAGYEQYEISNFSKPGFRSKHNSSYWQGKPYFGFGPAAHSFNGKNIRRWNIANNSLYIQSIEKNIIPFEEETLSVTQELNEYIMISLRTMEGLSLEKVMTKFGEDKKTEMLKNAGKYLGNKQLEMQNNHLQLTRKGKFFADGIAADLFF